jgi:hypothetical protein
VAGLWWAPTIVRPERHQPSVVRGAAVPWSSPRVPDGGGPTVDRAVASRPTWLVASPGPWS